MVQKKCNTKTRPDPTLTHRTATTCRGLPNMSTLLPFLYQTRTLQRLSRTGISTPAFRALLHSTSRTNTPRTETRGDQPRTRRPRGAEIPFDLPEGYENPDTKHLPGEDAGAQSTITPSERDAFSRIFEEIATRNKTGSPSAAEPAPPPSEDQPGAMPEEPTTARPFSDPISFGEVEDFRIRTEEPNSDWVRNTINIIVQDAAEVQSNSRRQIQKPFDRLHPLGQTGAAADWDRALLRFPPSLRRAARMALGVMEDDKAAETPGAAPPSLEEILSDEPRAAARTNRTLDPLSRSVQNEALRREERNRVEAKMSAAKTDFELWDVLEAEVFPMVGKLGIDEDPATPTPSTPTARAGRGTSKRAAAAAASTTPPKRDRKNKLPLHIYGPLYPRYLLHALRLFDTQFARSSPLALHLLPRVRELGPASYVLGVSTPFYNELARLLWNRYGDPAAVFNLLEEMRVAGLYCDEGTRGVVLSIEHFFASVGHGKWGPFLRELASLPEYEYAVLPRVKYWMSMVNNHIVARREDMQE